MLYYIFKLFSVVMSDVVKEHAEPTIRVGFVPYCDDIWFDAHDVIRVDTKYHGVTAEQGRTYSTLKPFFDSCEVTSYQIIKFAK
jgi:hypothetical protein